MAEDVTKATRARRAKRWNCIVDTDELWRMRVYIVLLRVDLDDIEDLVKIRITLRKTKDVEDTQNRPGSPYPYIPSLCSPGPRTIPIVSIQAPPGPCPYQSVYISPMPNKA